VEYPRKVVRSTDCGSFVVLTGVVPNPYPNTEGKNTALVVTGSLYDENGDFIKKVQGDNFDAIVRIGTVWLHELAVADARRDNDKARLFALEAQPWTF